MNIKTIKIERFKNAHHQSDFKGKLIFENDNNEELDFDLHNIIKGCIKIAIPKWINEIDLHDMTKDFIKMVLPKWIDEIIVKEHFNDVTQTINILDHNNDNLHPQIIKTTRFKMYRSDGTDYTIMINDIDTLQDLSKFEINKETNLNVQKTDILKWFDDFVADVSPNYIKFKARICEEIKNGNRN